MPPPIPGVYPVDVGGQNLLARAAKEWRTEAAYIIAVEVSPDLLAVARHTPPDIGWLQGNAAALPVAAAAADIHIFSLMPLEISHQFTWYEVRKPASIPTCIINQNTKAVFSNSCPKIRKTRISIQPYTPTAMR